MTSFFQSSKYKSVTFLKVVKEFFTRVHLVLVRLGYYEARCHEVMHLAQNCNSETLNFYMDHLGISFFNMLSMIHRELYMYFYSRTLGCVKHADGI